jgi:molybdopterin/thiamine biosynthesis adenylyltransferase
LPDVLVVGAGGLGCPLLLALAPHVRLTIADADRVALSNPQRQVLYRTVDVGRLKVECAADQIKATARSEGCLTFHKDGLRLVAEGKTSLEELQRVFKG